MINGKNTLFTFFIKEEIGKGRRIAISRSKSKKRRATKKNRKENGNREDFIGSNPHSYGDDFCKSDFLLGNKYPKENIIIVNNRDIIKYTVRFFIL